MRKNNWVGIDVGCTNVKLVSKIDDEFCCPEQFPTGDNLTKKDLIQIITDYVDCHHRTLEGLGIAFSGSTRNGYYITSTTLPCLVDFSIHDLRHLNCNSIKLINDSNAATLAGTIEFPTAKVLVGITNGTGIGCGVAICGNLFTGSNGFLGEIYGNYTMTESGELTKIGRIVSGSKIRNKNSKELQETIPYLNSLLSQVINFYNPDVIYFSGGGFEHHLRELKASIEFVKANCYKHLTADLRFELSKFGSFAGAVGALKFVL